MNSLDIEIERAINKRNENIKREQEYLASLNNDDITKKLALAAIETDFEILKNNNEIILLMYLKYKEKDFDLYINIFKNFLDYDFTIFIISKYIDRFEIDFNKFEEKILSKINKCEEFKRKSFSPIFGNFIRYNNISLIDLLNNNINPKKNINKNNIKIEIAENVFTSPDMLEKIVENDIPNDELTMLIISHRNTPYHLLINLLERNLERENADDIFYTILKNPKIKIDVLEEHADNENWNVRKYIINNPNITNDIIVKLSKDDYWQVRKYVAASPFINTDIIKELSNDEDWAVRRYIASNTKTPLSILRKLVVDEDSNVRNSVLKNPKYKQ